MRRVGPESERSLAATLGATRPLSTPLALSPAVGVVASEGALLLGRPDIALWGHLLVLAGCALAVALREAETVLLSVFALVSLFRLADLGAPALVESSLSRTLVVSATAVLAAGALAWHHDELRPPARPSIGPADLALAAVFGATLGYLGYLLARPEAPPAGWTVVHLGLFAVVVVGVAGPVEELLFRGLLQSTLQTRIGDLPGLLLASALFGAVHASGGPLAVAYAGAVGFLFGLLYDWSRSLALVALTHGLFEGFRLLAYPALLS